MGNGDLGMTDEKRLFETLGDLLCKLDRIVDVTNAQLEQNTLTTALLRGSQNSLLQSGMIQLEGSSGAWLWQAAYQVDFASVGYIDSLAAGPYTITTDAMGSDSGIGAFQTGDTLAATIPLIGKQLIISSTSTSDTPPSLFVAIFTDLRLS